jgi:endonuclease/exonuclease/phosphatase family metal-dependent hydrolase
MRVLTWNLNGLDDQKVDERTEAAVFIAVTGLTMRQLASGKTPHHPPDVLLFQEVTERTFEAHLNTHLPRGGYSLYPAVAPEREVFEVVAVRQPARIVTAETVPLERSLYGRNLHVVDVDGLPGIDGPVRFLTAHFDSGVEEGAARIAATRQVAAAMDERSIFGGDTNLRTAEWDQASEHVSVTDAWEAVGSPPDLKRTWRMFERGARFDRVWLGSGLQATQMSGLGTKALPGLPRGPSDHIGLLVEITDVR